MKRKASETKLDSLTDETNNVYINKSTQLSLVTNQLTLTAKSCPTVNRIISYSNLKFDSERQNKSKKCLRNFPAPGIL